MAADKVEFLVASAGQVGVDTEPRDISTLHTEGHFSLVGTTMGPNRNFLARFN
jgi:hypothetical protein